MHSPVPCHAFFKRPRLGHGATPCSPACLDASASAKQEIITQSYHQRLQFSPHPFPITRIMRPKRRRIEISKKEEIGGTKQRSQDKSRKSLPSVKGLRAVSYSVCRCDPVVGAHKASRPSGLLAPCRLCGFRPSQRFSLPPFIYMHVIFGHWPPGSGPWSSRHCRVLRP